MYSMLVIGLGRFGTALATRLAELGNEVMVIDEDEASVNKIAPLVTSAQIGDCIDEAMLSAAGARDFDICFVCIGQNLQSSLEATALLKELGAPRVVAKAGSALHAKLLLRIGADEVIYPERDMAFRVAARVSAKGAFDYFELSPEYAIYELEPPESWLGRSVRELDVRGNHNINIIGIKSKVSFRPIIDPDYRFKPEEHILAAGGKKDLARLLK